MVRGYIAGRAVHCGWVVLHIYEWVVSHIWMSHVPHMHDSCHTYERVMSHAWTSRVTHINGSFHTHEWVTSQTWVGCVTHMSRLCHTYERVLSHIWMSHITYEPFMSHIWTSHVTQVVDDHFIDLKNKQGVAASHLIHTYNGINWIDLLSSEDAKPLKARANRFFPPPFRLTQVTHTTALTRSTCYQLETPSHLSHAPNGFFFSFFTRKSHIQVH